MAISIGASFPDAELKDSLFSQALTRVAMNLAKVRLQPAQQSLPVVNLQFLLPGKFEKPGFSGMRIRSYDKASHQLFLESSVPSYIVGADTAEAYVVAAMQDATENAKDFFEEKTVDFNMSEHMEMISALSTAS